MKNSWKLDDFDSEIFGFRVAKIKVLDSKNVADLIKDLIKNKVKYATCRVESNNFSTIQVLEKSGLVLVDGLISLGINTLSTKIVAVASRIREANKNDLGQLKSLTWGLYSVSRVYNDPLISQDKADKFYIKWIENSILGQAADLVLAWDQDGKILGYVTLKKTGSIPLIGVSKQARGKGIAKELVKASLFKFKQWGVGEVIVETQMANIAALRLYQDCGFKVVDSFLTLRWALNG